MSSTLYFINMIVDPSHLPRIRPDIMFTHTGTTDEGSGIVVLSQGVRGQSIRQALFSRSTSADIFQQGLKDLYQLLGRHAGETMHGSCSMPGSL